MQTRVTRNPGYPLFCQTRNPGLRKPGFTRRPETRVSANPGFQETRNPGLEKRGRVCIPQWSVSPKWFNLLQPKTTTAPWLPCYILVVKVKGQAQGCENVENKFVTADYVNGLWVISVSTVDLKSPVDFTCKWLTLFSHRNVIRQIRQCWLPACEQWVAEAHLWN